MFKGSIGKPNINPVLRHEFWCQNSLCHRYDNLKHYFNSPSNNNGGVTGASGGASVLKPSEIPPAPWHPKAKDPGYSNSQSINNDSDDSSDSDSDSDTTQNISLAQQSKRRSSVVSDGGEGEDGKRNKPDE